ncbi:MAG: keto-deoxy-phosphogluconate aldolase [Rhodospirillales bacterium RIFCSPLOWO2_12_FULL_58_28]|nr:MAG: keto-deoxy-phosphogluconate aldolase [Rhodospirillales bacterium RIFCSPLOWO2_02_FULL_58_16]OHC78717.1 MAG: keto-deoxy-phosphogluconate aldolase [Rhodospirillales bacterium RIFCSPLOWO2_12_FULL_58_28]
MNHKQDVLEIILRLAPVIPVLIVHDPKTAAPLARALVAGGLKAIEVTLRTAGALDAVRAIAEEVEGAVPGVGTVLDAEQLAAAEKAGARFAVSPGSSPKLLDAADDYALPLLPGAATASEAMALLERGYRLQKFFPAEAIGGVACLKLLASPLPRILFCPTGGITAVKAKDYLALDNVICVGGSWVAPAEAVGAGDWPAVEALARNAAALR